MNLETLLAERAIYRQLVRFARAMDARDWALMQAIVADDVKADFGAGEIQGSASVITYIRSFLDVCGTTQHLLGNVLIEVAGDSAMSQAYVADMHLAKSSDSDAYFRTLGNYTDSWSRVNGVWLMTHRVKDNLAIMGTMDVFRQ